MILTLPVYKVVPNKDKFSIKKEDGKLVGGNWEWDTEEEAGKYLDRLISMKYCIGE